MTLPVLRMPARVEFVEDGLAIVEVVLAEEWCRARFELSGDANVALHLPEPEGEGIVQGVALLDVVGAVVSLLCPGYVFSTMNLQFRGYARIGESVSVHVRRRQARLGCVKLACDILRDGKSLLRQPAEGVLVDPGLTTLKLGSRG